jgi:NADPH2:quinone reductase
MAGVVEAVGEGVASFKAGDEVYGMVGGVGRRQGTLAERIVVSADLLACKPKNLSMRQAVALPLSVITAWEGLVDRAKVAAGQIVLIHAGAGGIGHVAVQIARAYGAKVFATVSAEKQRVVEDFGASAIDYRSVSVEQYVSEATGGTGFDIVYDTDRRRHHHSVIIVRSGFDSSHIQWLNSLRSNCQDAVHVLAINVRYHPQLTDVRYDGFVS